MIEVVPQLPGKRAFRQLYASQCELREGYYACELIRQASATGMSVGLANNSGAPQVLVFTPASVTTATLLGWYEADDPAIVTTGTWTWPNKASPGTNNLTQATNTFFPTLESTGWNGGKSVLFDGTNDILQANGIASSISGTNVTFTVVALVQSVTNAATKTLFGFGNTGASNQLVDFRMSDTTGKYAAVRRNDSGTNLKTATATGAVGTGRHYLRYTFNASAKSELRIDGGSLDTTLDGVSASADGNSGVTTLNTFAMGALVRNTSGQFFNFRVAAFAIYSGIVSGTEASQVESYFTTRHPL